LPPGSASQGVRAVIFSGGNADGAPVAAAAAQAVSKQAASVLNNGPVLSSIGSQRALRYDAAS
jgi:hypothetical protein